MARLPFFFLLLFACTASFAQIDLDTIPPPPPPPPPPPTIFTYPKYQVYENREYKIQFSYPGHWYKIDLEDQGLISVGGIDFEGDSFPDIVNLRSKFMSAGLSPKGTKLVLDSVMNVMASFTGLKQLHRKRLKIGKIKAAEQTLVGAFQNIYAQYKFVLFFRDGYYYQFLFLYNPKEEKVKEKMCREIIKSIKLL